MARRVSLAAERERELVCNAEAAVVGAQAAEAVGELVGVHLEQHALRGALAGGVAPVVFKGRLAVRRVGGRIHVALVDGHGVQLRADGTGGVSRRQARVATCGQAEAAQRLLKGGEVAHASACGSNGSVARKEPTKPQSRHRASEWAPCESRHRVIEDTCVPRLRACGLGRRRQEGVGCAGHDGDEQQAAARDWLGLEGAGGALGGAAPEGA
eukprot:scaffold2885_cov65-Phaeocystis_antarctica.AAC.4